MKSLERQVAEFQGIYGPFTVAERLLQKIWLRGDFDRNRARTLDGEAVTVRFAGKWNLLGGPDFTGAILEIGGREVSGDVEIHFHEADWMAHRHHRDPAYDRVVLHVLLFAPPHGRAGAVNSIGQPMPTLVLLDLLFHDLEEYAAEDALEAALERSHWQTTERLLEMSPDDRRRLLFSHSRCRWQQKVHFAGLRLQKLCWEEACHATALEILGYRRNRVPMLNVAARYPFQSWGKERPGVEALLAAGGDWRVQGARPWNRPSHRLGQYLAWIEALPQWPTALFRLDLPDAAGPGETGAAAPVRKAAGLPKLREEWAARLTGGQISGSRLDTLLCDGFLPLLAAAKSEANLFGLWFSWYAGDLPDRVAETLTAAEIIDRRGHVSCNGYGQGVLSLSLEQRGDPLACIEEGNTA